MKIHGKTVLITGGRRIGSVLAEQLAARGANLCLSYLTSRDKIETTADICRKKGVRAACFQADLRDHLQADTLVKQTVNEFGSLDVLVNLTSIYTRTPFADLAPQHYDDMLASNLTAPYWTALAAARVMQRQPVVEGLQGKIIQFVDWAVDRPYRDFLPYLVAKGGLVTLTKALAVELAPTITVNAIAPGTVEPPPGLPESRLNEIRRATALNRIGSATDVVQAALFLIEGTDFMTGEVVRVDGGRFLGAAGNSKGGA